MLDIVKRLSYEEKQRYISILELINIEVHQDSLMVKRDAASIISKAALLTEELYDMREEIAMRIHHIRSCLSNGKHV